MGRISLFLRMGAQVRNYTLSKLYHLSMATVYIGQINLQKQNREMLVDGPSVKALLPEIFQIYGIYNDQ